jgi:putative nucleotidyltransferase with HDIG domain
MPPGIGIVGHCARLSKPVIVNDVKADARYYAQIDNLAFPNTQSILCAPLIRQGRVIGVIQIVNKVDGTWFDDGDLELLQMFGVQSAVALGNAQLYSDLRHSFADTVRAINNAIEARDGITSSHTNRVTNIALAIADELHWHPEKIHNLEIGSLLHDIGKIGMPDRLLFKEGIFTEDEYLEFKDHPLVGARMLSGVTALEPVLPYVLYHQERYDGKGYPFGLAGDAIPLEGRLLSVADTFDAMTSDRPYRTGLTEEQAIAEITRQRGTQFDPVIVDALVAAYQKGKLKGIAQSSTSPMPAEGKT